MSLKPPSEKITLFVYGSLLDPEGMKRAIGRKPSLTEMMDMELHGVGLSWSSSQRVSISGEECEAGFLTLMEKKGGSVLGKTIEVSLDELKMLALREKGYEIVRFPVVDREILTFMDRRCPIEKTIPKEYLKKILSGARKHGENFFDEYERRLPIPKAFLEGEYVFVDWHQKLRT